MGLLQAAVRLQGCLEWQCCALLLSCDLLLSCCWCGFVPSAASIHPSAGVLDVLAGILGQRCTVAPRCKLWSSGRGCVFEPAYVPLHVPADKPAVLAVC